MAKQLAQEKDGQARDPDLPPAFDPGYYLAANPDLDLTADAASGHYERSGRAEGRVASPLALRENLIALIADGRSVLEIGPFCDPLLRGPNIAYLDILDAEQLRARAIEIGADPAGCPEHVDYVGGLEQVHQRFDAVISSHAIEHQPDLVHHLQQVERILAPDGLFCLIVPDKRYCFDHHIAESTIAEVLQAHHEQRRVHRLANVLEHVALTTHNDSRRHWAGDHGPAIPADQPRRLRHALRDYDASGGGYIDVHAWYFTPDRFRTIVETLGALDLTGFEVAGVYDPARDRNEFCAVLKLDVAARERAAGRDVGGGIIFLQTADAEHYAPMLALTGPNVRGYCRRHNLGYESFTGIKRGFHPWQATFNRIPMLVELVERGFTGWAIYLDADAYIQDRDFNIAAYLAGKGDRAAIFAASGVTGHHWDVNAGVAMINLGHPLGRELVTEWAAGFARHDDDALRDAEAWFGPGNDQDLLHQILQRGGAIADAVLVEPMSFINGPQASFIRQHLRTLSPSFEERMRAIGDAVAAVERSGGGAGAAVSQADQKWTARLAHRDALQPVLAEAPVPPPRLDLAADLCAEWARHGAAAGSDDFTTALARGDNAAVADELAALGRSAVGLGILGGARQHDRARSRLFADQLARWTYDKLVSLAEAVGVLPLENPESGRWGYNALADPAALFADISAALDADLSPPEHVGGHLGISVGRGQVLHMRMLDAIHGAWRLRQLAQAVGLGADARIAEVGGGAGLGAFYARRLGLRGYRLYDVPAMRAVQSYVTADPAGPAPFDAIARAQPGSIDILFNADTLPDFGTAAAVAQLRAAHGAGIRHILSINQEAAEAERQPMAALVREAGGYRLAARHRHWLRAGYVEEHYIADRPSGRGAEEPSEKRMTNAS